MNLPIKNKGGNPLPETTLKKIRLKHEANLIKRDFKILILRAKTNLQNEIKRRIKKIIRKWR